ncbi:MAG: ribose 5-phosphate isomerase B [Chloroflexi bacterium]|nr:ribose 5-phosphate isomerase B [Chloroflexota bacterium]
MNIVIGSDHGGFDLKEILKAFLEGEGHNVLDYGTYSKDAVDYPDIALLVAQKVSEDGDFVGIVIDGAGMGSAMAANKVPGIRAAACYDTYAAGNSREHNDANVLTLGSMITGPGLAKEIAKKWLGTSFAGGRHSRRVNKIIQIEEKYLKK